MLEARIGLRKTVPSSAARMVPFGLFHCFLSEYSFTRSSFGVIVAHLTATPRRLVASAASHRHRVVGVVAVLEAEVVVLGLEVDVGQDQLVLHPRPEDARHLVAVHLHDRGLHRDLGHTVLSTRLTAHGSRLTAHGSLSPARGPGRAKRDL